MNQFEIIAESRQGTGRANVRRLRRTGLVPGVIYGGTDAPESVSVNLKDFTRQLEHEAFFSHILTVKVGGKSSQVVLKDLQRHPMNERVIHIDLLRVTQGQALTMNVPVHFLNEETAPGKKAGGLFTHHMSELSISCLPKDLPESINIEVGHMEIGDIVHLHEVTLPAGVELTGYGEDAQDAAVVSLHHAQKLDVEEEPAEQEEEGGEEAGEGSDHD